MTSLQGTGEEWKALDGSGEHYQVGADAHIVQAARQNIEKIRKRDVELRLVDAAGKPCANTPIEIVQSKQAFSFGDQLWWLDNLYRFNEAETDRGLYQKLRFKELLNAANALCYWTERPRNDGPKTEDLQGLNRTEGFAYQVDWASSQGLTVKGHPLFWSIPKCIPDWVKRYDYATQMKFAEVRVRNLVARFKGRVTIWDAVNEPMWEAAFKNLAQRDWPHLETIENIVEYIAPVLRWCKEEDPDACFLVNDYGMEADKQGSQLKARDGTVVTAALQRQRYLELLKALCDGGTPPDAVGLQSHTGGWLSHRAQVAVYDQMATSGLPIHITEFWASTKELETQGKHSQEEIDALQAEYVVDYLTCAFGHPAVEAFFFWGLTGATVRWYDRSSHELKPLYYRLQDLLQKQWMTRLQPTTNAQGVVQFRGFFGNYHARLQVRPDYSVSLPFTIAREHGAQITLQAPSRWKP